MLGPRRPLPFSIYRPAVSRQGPSDSVTFVLAYWLWWHRTSALLYIALHSTLLDIGTLLLPLSRRQ